MTLTLEGALLGESFLIGKANRRFKQLTILATSGVSEVNWKLSLPMDCRILNSHLKEEL